jgi:hypothetical protein
MYEGPEAIRRFCEGWIEVYEDFVLRPRIAERRPRSRRGRWRA